MTAAVVPVLLAAGGSGAPDPSALCEALTDTLGTVVAGAVGTVNNGAGSGASAPAGGVTNAAAVGAVASSASPSKASLAFTGAELWILALVALGLVVAGAAALRFRRRLV